VIHAKVVLALTTLGYSSVANLLLECGHSVYRSESRVKTQRHALCGACQRILTCDTQGHVMLQNLDRGDCPNCQKPRLWYGKLAERLADWAVRELEKAPT